MPCTFTLPVITYFLLSFFLAFLMLLLLFCLLFALLFFLLLLFCFKAVAYGLDRLRSISEVFIRDNTDVSNVLVMLVVANKLKEEEIERFLLGFMKDVNRYTNIIKQPQASEIAQSNKGFFLSFFLLLGFSRFSFCPDLYVTMSQVLAQAPESFKHSLDSVIIVFPSFLSFEPDLRYCSVQGGDPSSQADRKHQFSP